MRDRAKWLTRLDKTLKPGFDKCLKQKGPVIIFPSKRPACKRKNQGLNCVRILPYENETQPNHKAIANLFSCESGFITFPRLLISITFP